MVCVFLLVGYVMNKMIVTQEKMKILSYVAKKKIARSSHVQRLELVFPIGKSFQRGQYI